LIPDYPIGDSVQPGPCQLSFGHLFDTPPGDGEHVCGCVFGIAFPESAQAVSVDIAIVSLEHRVEAQI
jgi:hypothetical protein